jgi:glutaredoxin
MKRPALTLVLAAAGWLAAGAAAAQSAALPYELRQVVQRYPVQLITGKDCRSCDGGRRLLEQRGIPYTEKRVDSSADAKALKALTGAQALPVLRVGNQQMVGLVASEWHGYLDAAGYPKDSRLPAGWRAPAAEPLAPAGSAPETPPHLDAPPAPAAVQPTVPAAADDGSRPKIRF